MSHDTQLIISSVLLAIVAVCWILWKLIDSKTTEETNKILHRLDYLETKIDPSSGNDQ